MIQTIKKLSKVALFLSTIIVYIILGFIFITTVPYAFYTEIYDIQKPLPFHGNTWLNPYSSCTFDNDNTAWKKSNFHGHSKEWGGLTDGKTDKDVFFKKYKSMGYHSIGLSNYQYISSDFAKDNGFVPCYEHGYNVWKRHHVCIGAQNVVWLDFIWGQSLHHKQSMINILKPTVQVLALAHPKFRNSFEPEDFAYLSNYDCIEVLNHYRTSDIHWDSALSNGHKVWIVADDDTHNVLDSGETGVCWTMIYAPNNGNQQEITQALKNGQAFGVQGKQGKMDIFPKLIHLSDSIYSINMMDTVESISLIGQNGKKLAISLNSHHIDYKLKKTDTYIRAIIKTPQTTLWLNPVLRDSKTAIPRKNELHTILYRLLWITGYAILIVLVWKKKRIKIDS